MDALYSAGIALSLAFIPTAVIVVIIYMVKKLQRKNKISPLTSNLLRPYGYTLQENIYETRIDIFAKLTEVIVVALMLPLMLMIQVYVFNSKISLITWVIFACMMCVMFCIYLIQIIKMLKKLQKYRLGYSCEMAVGQELENLIRPINHPYRLYHDIPFENYNIDHLVVCTNGVFVVETKGRSKQLLDGSKQYKVTVENDSLIFPTHIEKEPIEQVRRNVQSVKKWLENSTGLDVPVAGILILPGWFIELKQKAINPYILNAAALPKVFPKLFAGNLELSQVTAIAYQVEQRVRDIEKDR